jgi:hypothetical protein
MRGALAVVVAGLAAAHGAPACADELLRPLAPAIVEYRWHPLVPHWVVDHRIVRAPATLAWDSVSVRYALPDFDLVSRRIGVFPHFECKYADFWLPNACTTRWEDVYVDVPVAVLRRDALDVDVPGVRRPGDEVVVDVPRVEWKEETLVVSLPALVAAGCPATIDRNERCAR